MKKVFLVLFATIVFSMQGFAQKGMQGIGVNFSTNFSLVDGGMGFGGSVKYQYNVSDYIRLEPSFSFYGVSEDAFNMTGLVNVHIFFSSPRFFRPYFFVGPGYVSFTDDHSYNYGSYYYEDKETDPDFGVNGGFGLDFRVSHNFSLQLEAGGIIGVSDDDEICGKLSIGFCYNF